MNNIGTYFEIPVNDMERAINFYSFIFDCELSRDNIHGNEMAFFPFTNEVSGITGALAQGETYKPSINGTLIYLNTPEIDHSISKIIKAGGEILFPKTAVPDYGFVAEFKDCEGNRVALFQST